MPSSAGLRRALVEQLELGGQIRTPAVRDAFLAVPREYFLPAVAASDGLEAVYRNDAIVTKKDADGAAVSSSSAPTIMALMLEQLRLEPGQRVLEIGAGTGYNAALIKHVVGPSGRVTAIDIDPATARDARANLKRAKAGGIRVFAGDGRAGYANIAPFDRIIATASVRDVPRAWHRQLARDGLVEFPLTLTNRSYLHQVVATFEKDGRGLRSVAATAGGFMSMRPSGDAPAEIGPYAVVEMRGEGAPRTILGLTGEAFIDADDEQRRRLVSLAAGELRSKAVRGKLANGVMAYILLAGEPGRSFAGGMGLADRDAKGIAFLLWRDGRFRLYAAGRPGAEQRLLRLIDGWKRAGRPRLDDLRIRVAFGRSEPRAWRTSRRQHSTVSFDWSTRPRRT